MAPRSLLAFCRSILKFKTSVGKPGGTVRSLRLRMPRCLGVLGTFYTFGSGVRRMAGEDAGRWIAKTSPSHGDRGRVDEIEKVHIAAADGRLSAATAGNGRYVMTCKCAGNEGPHGACVLLRIAVMWRTFRTTAVVRACCGCELHSTEIELYVSPSFDNDERHIRCGRRPAACARRRVPVSRACSLSAREGRREANAFRTGSLDTLRWLPRSSRIGLRLLRDRCRVRRSVISFNQ